MQNNLIHEKGRIKATTLSMVNFSAFLLVFIFLISFSSADLFALDSQDLQVGLDGGPTEIGINFETPFNFSTVNTVNTTFWWYTSTLGPLRTLDASQFNNVGGVGIIDETYLRSFGNGEWLELDQDNWFNDSFGWIYWDTATPKIVFNQSKLETVFFNATVVDVVTGTEEGTLANIQTYNNIPYNVSEDASDFELRVNFSVGVGGDFNQLIIRYKSAQEDLNHVPSIQIYDYDEDEWENYGSLPAEGIYHVVEFGVFDSDEHVDANGIVQVRIVQDEGVPPKTHIHNFDWVTIVKGFGTPSGDEVDPFAIHFSGDVPWMGNENGNGFNSSGWDFIFANNITQGGLLLDDIYFKLNGSTPMQGNTNFGGFGGFNILDLNSSSGLWNITSDGFFQGDGSQLTGIEHITDYWKTTTSQTGLTGDKTGSFDLTTTGTINSGQHIIDVDSAEALLVRADGDGGDVMIVDTLNEKFLFGIGASSTNGVDIRSKGGDGIGDLINVQPGGGEEVTSGASGFMGGEFQVIGGRGGAASGTATRSGDGGRYDLRGGAAGQMQTNGVASNLRGGKGGDFFGTTGDGAAVSLSFGAGTTGTSTGGDGGTFSFTSGRGGDADIGSQSFGGDGGGVFFFGGNGGESNNAGGGQAGDGGGISFFTGRKGSTGGAASEGVDGKINFAIGFTTIATFLSDLSGLQFPDNIATIFGSANDFIIRHTGLIAELFNTNGDIVINNSLGSGFVVIDSDLDVIGSIFAEDGFTGDCVNASYVSGIAVGCND